MKIIIDRQRIFARHGVLPQEREVGAYFVVSAEIDTPHNPNLVTDELKDTISYADVAHIIKEEMNQPSQLLEHVAWRMARRILKDFSAAQRVRVRVMKENPPMGIECKGAGVEITQERD